MITTRNFNYIIGTDDWQCDGSKMLPYRSAEERPKSLRVKLISELLETQSISLESLLG